MAIFEVKDLKKKFGSVQVLKGINFTMDEGEVASVIGSSGSGKTTLLRCINFLETADSGKIVVDDTTVFDGEDKKSLTASVIRKNQLNFGLVFQSLTFFRNTVYLKILYLLPKCLQRKERTIRRINIRF